MSNYVVELPGGATPIPLQSQEEVDKWVTLESQYREQYDLRKVNDLTNLGTLLIHHINLGRAQLGLSGRVPKVDDEGLATGEYEQRVLKPGEVKSYQEQITNAGKEIRATEQAMGIDKKSRDQAGDETLRGYLSEVKARAHRYGLHINRRVHRLEEFAMEMRWRVRLNEIGDPEDKNYENCTDEGIIKWAREQLAEMEEADKKFAQSEGNALVVGSAR